MRVAELNLLRWSRSRSASCSRREPASSILRRFNLSDIEQYYPAYRELILWRMAEKQ